MPATPGTGVGLGIHFDFVQGHWQQNTAPNTPMLGQVFGIQFCLHTMPPFFMGSLSRMPSTGGTECQMGAYHTTDDIQIDAHCQGHRLMQAQAGVTVWTTHRAGITGEYR